MHPTLQRNVDDLCRPQALLQHAGDSAPAGRKRCAGLAPQNDNPGRLIRGGLDDLKDCELW